MTKYSIRTMAIDNARYALMREVLEQIGFNYDRKIGNVKLVRPLQIASVSPVIESWFRTGAIRWGVQLGDGRQRRGGRDGCGDVGDWRTRRMSRASSDIWVTRSEHSCRRAAAMTSASGVLQSRICTP